MSFSRKTSVKIGVGPGVAFDGDVSDMASNIGYAVPDRTIPTGFSPVDTVLLSGTITR